QRQQLLGGVVVALPDGGQDARDFTHGRCSRARGQAPPGLRRAPSPESHQPLSLPARPPISIPPSWPKALAFLVTPLVIEHPPAACPTTRTKRFFGSESLTMGCYGPDRERACGVRERTT